MSLIIFYSLGLIYEEDSIFQQYTSVMMFVNVACTCFSQMFISFIFHMMAEPIEIAQNLNDGKTEIIVRRDGQRIHSWREDDLKQFVSNPNGSRTQINEAEETKENYAELPGKRVKSESDLLEGKEDGLDEDQRALFRMFFAFADPN